MPRIFDSQDPDHTNLIHTLKHSFNNPLILDLINYDSTSAPGEPNSTSKPEGVDEVHLFESKPTKALIESMSIDYVAIVDPQDYKNYEKVIEAMKAYVDVKLSNRKNNVLRKYEKSKKELNETDAIYNGLYGKINQKTNDIVFGLGILVIFAFAYFSNTSKESVLTLLGFFGIAAYKVLPAINNMMDSLLAIKNSSFVIPLLLILNKVWL